MSAEYKNLMGPDGPDPKAWWPLIALVVIVLLIIIIIAIADPPKF